MIFNTFFDYILNESELIFFLHTVKYFHFFLSITNNSINYQSFVCKKFNVYKYCCTPMDPHIWPSKSRTTSSNIHTAPM